MPTTIHLVLAYISALATALVAAEAAWRAIQATRPASAARWLSAMQLLSLAITALAGFALIAGGAAAGDGLHYLLAVVALASVPAAPMFSLSAGARGRAVATFVAAAVALVVVALLFLTG